MTTADLLLASLRSVTEATIQSAGPRYSPAFAPGSPNLSIEGLERAVSAQCLSTSFRTRLSALALDLRSNRTVRGHTAADIMRRRSVSFESVSADLDLLATAPTASEMRSGFQGLRRHLALVSNAIGAAQARSEKELTSTATDALDVPAAEGRPTRREQIRSRLESLLELSSALDPIRDMMGGHEGTTAPDAKPVLLLGQWGTGKTHFACDVVLAMLQDGVPAVVVLAPTLDGGNPLDELANQLGISDSTTMLDQLEDHARKANRRALIVIDAINEADREAWRRRLPTLLKLLSRRRDLGLVLTCRTPFDQQMVDAPVREALHVVHHPGFETQEFDAQLEFFDFYSLPALHVPLLSAEFGRPLFLKLMCEGLVRQSRRTQKKHLEGISSGQKGMTYVLVNFVGSIGEEIEGRHGLGRMACWYLLKGRQRHGHLGMAGRLADLRQEWLSPADVRAEITSQTGLTADAAINLVRDMVTSGLLVDQMRYEGGTYVDGLALPYQRFSDHLVARHLLATSLDTSSIARLRRSFYSNRRLGAVFQIERGGWGFAEPGIASALMVEFPERVKRVAGSTYSTELLTYLPRGRRLLYPFAEAFIEGLYWRDAQSFGPETERLVRMLLERCDSGITNQLFEVLLGIAVRHTHPWNAVWLWSRLSEMEMAPRDLSWSEFIRLAEVHGNTQRLLAWSERPSALTVDEAIAANLIKLLALMTTTTERIVRDRATRAMVHLGERQPVAVFELVERALDFNDPYLSERVLAASYGVAMRHWGLPKRHGDFDSALAATAKGLIRLVLQPGALRGTWHSLTRSYAEGIVEVLRLIRPRLVGRNDQLVLKRSPAPDESPFRDAALISADDTVDGESTIHMDFGNYTIGRLVKGRSNYDMGHPAYVGLRKQIADRVRQLGYRAADFKAIDRTIANFSSDRRDGHRTDRYGKKYAWIAYFEMYGLRSRTRQVEDYGHREPRTTDCDIDPSFPMDPPIWQPTIANSFDNSPTDHGDWLAKGQVPDYEALLELETVDGVEGGWVLLDATIREGVPDGRETQAWVTSAFVPERSVRTVRHEMHERTPQNRDLPEPGTDFYTYLGEVPWSERFGSDIRRADGTPRTLADRAFDDFAGGRWQTGIAVEATSRTWGWESYHSPLNQTGSMILPSPALAAFRGLRSVQGSADLIDATGRISSIFRRRPGPSFGSTYLYVRKDIVDAYTQSRSLRLVRVVRGEQTIHHDYLDGPLAVGLTALFQSHVSEFAIVNGPVEPASRGSHNPLAAREPSGEVDRPSTRNK